LGIRLHVHLLEGFPAVTYLVLTKAPFTLDDMRLVGLRNRVLEVPFAFTLSAGSNHTYLALDPLVAQKVSFDLTVHLTPLITGRRTPRAGCCAAAHSDVEETKHLVIVNALPISAV